SSGVVDAWMASPSHRDNLMKPTYREVGFAVVNGNLLGEDTTLVVQMFGTKNGAIVAQAPEIVPSQPAAPVAVIPSPSAVKPVVIPAVASVSEARPASGFSIPAVAGVFRNPSIDIVSLRRDISFAFAGVILGIFIVDFYLAMKRHTVRAV